MRSSFVGFLLPSFSFDDRLRLMKRSGIRRQVGQNKRKAEVL
ncbi:hypothetical protein [Clostridium cadaveris]